MELFEYSTDKVLPKAHTLLIQEFKKIWDRDKSKDKGLALGELAFVFYLMDYKSIYLSTVPEEREQVIIDDLFPGIKWTPDEVVKQACKKYEELQVVPAMRLLKSLRHTLEELMKFFDNVKYTRIVKPTELTKSMSEAAKVLEAIAKVEETVRKELGSKGKTKGDREIGAFEDPEK